MNSFRKKSTNCFHELLSEISLWIHSQIPLTILSESQKVSTPVVSSNILPAILLEIPTIFSQKFTQKRLQEFLHKFIWKQPSWDLIMDFSEFFLKISQEIFLELQLWLLSRSLSCIFMQKPCETSHLSANFQSIFSFFNHMDDQFRAFVDCAPIRVSRHQRSRYSGTTFLHEALCKYTFQESF